MFFYAIIYPRKTFGEKIVIGKGNRDNNKSIDKNSLILMLGILNGKLDEIISILGELNKKAKRTKNPAKNSIEKTMDEN